MTAPTLADLASLADPAVIANPYPLFERLREASPFTELDDALVVFARYEDCSRILRDSRASSERERSRLVPPELQAQALERTRSFLSLDPPDHTSCEIRDWKRASMRSVNRRFLTMSASMRVLSPSRRLVRDYARFL